MLDHLQKSTSISHWGMGGWGQWNDSVQYHSGFAVTAFKLALAPSSSSREINVIKL